VGLSKGLLDAPELFAAELWALSGNVAFDGVLALDPTGVPFLESGPPSPNRARDSAVLLRSPLKRFSTAEFLLSSGKPISRRAASLSQLALSFSLTSLARGFEGLLELSSVRNAFSVVGSRGGRFLVSRFEAG
jgi:hypothetical protein